MSDNWVVQAMQSAFEIWNDKLTEIWSLITTTPQEFRGGDIWNAIVGINEGLKAVGYGLLVLFFAMGIFQSAASFRDLQRPEYALRHFIRFIAAKVAVSSAMEIMTVVFSICGGIVQSVMSGMGGMVAAGVTVPQEMVNAIENVGFLASIPLWLVAMLGNLFITVMSFILIMTVYGRFFRLYIFTALAPIPLATFAGEGTSFAGKQFIKSYIGVCMEGAVIVLACLIFSAFMSSGSPVLDTNLTPVVMAWQYIAETIFNMLVLVGLVKGAVLFRSKGQGDGPAAHPPVSLLPDFDLRSAFLDLKTNLVIPIPHGLRRPALLHDLPHDPLLLHVRGQPGADPAEDRHQHQTGQDGPVQRLLLCHPFREDQVRAGGVEQYRSQFQLY